MFIKSWISYLKYKQKNDACGQANNTSMPPDQYVNKPKQPEVSLLNISQLSYEFGHTLLWSLSYTKWIIYIGSLLAKLSATATRDSHLKVT
jgi:hypothetical protein